MQMRSPGLDPFFQGQGGDRLVQNPQDGRNVHQPKPGVWEGSMMVVRSVGQFHGQLPSTVGEIYFHLQGL
jgi:hypothetical protein